MVLFKKASFIGMGANPTTRLRARVKDERSPVAGLTVDGAATDQLELGITKRRGRIVAGTDAGIKVVHQPRRSVVVHFPKGCDHLTRASVKKGPGQSDEPLAGVGTRAGTVTARDRDEPRPQMVLEDVTGVELVGIALSGEHDRGVERPQTCGDGVGHEMDVAVLAGRRGLVSAWRRFPPLKGLAGGWEVML